MCRYDVILRLLLLGLFMSCVCVVPAIAQNEPTPAQLVRSDGSVPSVPQLTDEKLTYDNLKKLLESKSHIERYTGAANLMRCSLYGWKGTREQANELGTLALRDFYWAVQREGAKFAYFRGKEGAGMIPALVLALDAQEPLVRGQAALALEQTGGVDEALTRLAGMLATGDQLPEVASALSTTEKGREALQERTASPTPVIRLFSNAGLIKGGGEEFKGAVTPYLKDLRTVLTSNDKAEVIQACKSVDLTLNFAGGAGQEIVALLCHEDLGVRIAAALALQYSTPKDPAVVEAIVKVVTEKEIELPDDKDIRARCIFTLGRIGENARPAIPVLIRLMEKDPSTRNIVVEALLGIDPEAPAVLAALLKLFKDSINERRPNDSVNEQVIIALGRYGPAAKEAVPDLVKALGVKNRHPYHVPAAIWTLGQIGPDAAAARAEVEEYLRGPFHDLAAAALARITAKDPATMPPMQKEYPGPGVKF